MQLTTQDEFIEVGCDEAGRGPLAGPVVGAAVILPPNFSHPLLNDSKKVSEKNRIILRDYIKEQAIDYGIGLVDHEMIDEINILQASFLAIHRALDSLKNTFDLIAMDGNRFLSYKNKKHTCIVKGDAKYQHIAAASILAKTYRDDLMWRYHQEFPEYGWDKNKGYPTKAHRMALEKYGPSPYHRKSFRLLP